MSRVVLLICFMLFVGCSTPQHSWPRQERNTVWTAMIAAAKSPDYDADDPRKRWIVVENKVDVNPKIGKILVRRKLGRSLKLPMQVEQYDERDWFFTIQLLPQNTPTVTFDTVNQVMVPAQVQDEAQRYFNLIDELVGN